MTLKLGKVSRGPHLPALVASSITREIAQGRLKPGDQLPTEQAIVAATGVSRTGGGAPLGGRGRGLAGGGGGGNPFFAEVIKPLGAVLINRPWSRRAGRGRGAAGGAAPSDPGRGTVP